MTTRLPIDVQAKATETVAFYTLAATVTGAVPVPAASAAIVAENGAMIAHIASICGTPISVGNVMETIGLAGTLNIVGRNLFIEGARLLSWGTGSVWAMPLLMALGAATAGLQTYIVGLLAIEIAKNGGQPLSGKATALVIANAKSTYEDFVAEWRKRSPGKPA